MKSPPMKGSKESEAGGPEGRRLIRMGGRNGGWLGLLNSSRLRALACPLVLSYYLSLSPVVCTLGLVGVGAGSDLYDPREEEKGGGGTMACIFAVGAL